MLDRFLSSVEFEELWEECILSIQLEKQILELTYEFSFYNKFSSFFKLQHTQQCISSDC